MCAWFLLGIGGWHDGAMESDGGTVIEEASPPGVLSVSAKNMSALSFLSTHFCCRMCTYIILSYSYNLYLKYLTCAHKTSRVRVPSSIWCAHCPCLPSWNKPWVALEEYLSSLQYALICVNGTITRSNGSPTTGWKNTNITWKLYFPINGAKKLKCRVY